MTGLNALTEKEKQTLPLILRGHDAKSAARELALSVHTVNERLRDARRLLAEETPESSPEIPADKPLGDAPGAAPAAEGMTSAARRWAWFGLGPGLTLPTIGVLAMSLILAALFLPASPLSVLPVAVSSGAAATAEPTEAAAARSAEDFLTLVDDRHWAESYALTGAQFRALNTLERWSEVSEQVRPLLGKLLTRDLVANEYVPAPPKGYQLIKFRSTYANGTVKVESLSLAWENGAWRVVGIVIG